MPDDRELVEAALEAARAAGRLHREQAGRLEPAQWSEKGTSDFVTEVDLEAERLIVASLRGRFPDHAFLAEEGTPEEDDASGAGGASSAPLTWLIDPLDGTTNWLHGYPEYAVSIAGFDAHGIRVGVVLDSATEEEYVALRRGGSRRNGAPIHTSGLHEMRLALIGTGFPFKRLELLPPYLAMLGSVLRRSSGVRRAGAAALDLCALASGRLDAFWELWLMPWDVAAGALIVREAGGFFGALELEPEDRLGDDLAGAIRRGRAFAAICDGEQPTRPLGGGAYLAANGHLREALRGILSAG